MHISCWRREITAYNQTDKRTGNLETVKNGNTFRFVGRKRRNLSNMKQGHLDDHVLEYMVLNKRG